MGAPRHHLVLSGFMGAGKTTVGRAVAARAGVEFLDTDELLLEEANWGCPPPVALRAPAPPKSAASRPQGGDATGTLDDSKEGSRTGTFASVAEVFTTLGEPAFRRLEAAVLAKALVSNTPCVIAVGGGALLMDSIRRPLLERARVVTLTAHPRVLLERTSAAGAPGRPLLDSSRDLERVPLAATTRFGDGDGDGDGNGNGNGDGSRFTVHGHGHGHGERAGVVSVAVAAGRSGSAMGPESGAESRLARIESLLAARAPVYAEAHATIPTDDGRSIDEIATAVLRAWEAPALVVPLGQRSYPVRFAGAEGAGAIVRELLESLRPSSWAHVTDSTVRALHGARFLGEISGAPPVASVTLRPGEREKHLGAVQELLGALVDSGADRGTVVVAHGGGVVSDIAGFAAAVLLRGVRWISVPTTLLSMADAAIGGKTGVDIGRAKNAAGAFHQPSAVVIDVRHVATETPRAFRSGLAEIVKSAAIADPALFALLESAAAPHLLSRDVAFLESAVYSAAAVKIRIVSQDERESGPRALLNFGHTLGHALEAAGDFERWTHGEAVALGMIAAARAGRALGVTSPSAAERLTSLLRALGLPTDLRGPDVEAALPFLSLDKKRRGATVRAVFLTEIGHAVLHDLPLPDLARLFTEVADR